MRRTLAVTVCGALVAAGLSATAVAAAASPAAAPAGALGAAAGFVAARPAVLHPGSGDTYAAKPVLTGGNGLQYVPYDRSYRGLPVLGGDFVVVTSGTGQVLSTSVGQQSASLTLATTPRVARVAAASTARAQLPGGAVQSTTLVVDATGATARLAWESLVTGVRAGQPSRLHVVVDALTGAVRSTRDEVVDGTGTGTWNGPTPVAITTSGSGTSYSMTDGSRPGISCRDFTSHAVLTGTDDVWGNGDATQKETGCVDALYTVQHEWSMLGSWLGRNGIDGSGGGFPIYMGLNDVNAYWDGTSVSVGHNNANQYIGSQDVVGHEFGHAIDSNTPGGQSGNGVSEATGDIFGTSTEYYSNQPAPYDTPDFTIGEQVNLVGSGPIRNMADPGTVGDPRCYTSSIPSAETHAAAGPFDHWFYLVAGGQAAPGGAPTSKCNGAVVSGGLGVQGAVKVFYNAMLAKTSGMTYLKYRTATLNAAKNLYPGSCAAFATVKAAWDAVTVPAQSADPTCTTSGGGAVVASSPGSRTGTVGTAVSPFTLTASGGTGTYTWTATGLPPGVVVSSAGVVSGTPTTAGSYTVTATATSGGSSGSTSFAFVVSPAGSSSCSAQVVANGGFESGSAGWTGTTGSIGAWGSQGEPAHGGTYSAWLDGYGSTHTESVAQTVSVPAGCSRVTVGFWLHVDSAETTTSTQYDKLTVKLGSTTVATYSNLDKGTGYVQRTYAVPVSSAAASYSLSFSGSEDSSLQTSFVVDDVSATLG